MATGFVFKNHNMAREYIKRRDELGLKTDKECHDLLLAMAIEGKMAKVFSNKRTPDQWLADQRKKGFKIDDQRRSRWIGSAIHQYYVSRRAIRHNTKHTVGGFFRELARLVKVYLLGRPS